MDVALRISRTLSYSVIILSFCMKIPQILAILSAKHSKGVNVRGYWMEIGRYSACPWGGHAPCYCENICWLIYLYDLNSYLIGASYGYFNDFHISTYGEAILLAIQSKEYWSFFQGNEWSFFIDMIMFHKLFEQIIAIISQKLQWFLPAGCMIIFLSLYYGKFWSAENAAFALL